MNEKENMNRRCPFLQRTYESNHCLITYAESVQFFVLKMNFSPFFYDMAS